ncbi:MAG: STAS domain-containing protein [Gammaproteobacteria bacterium]|nr:STAS domain-containing protein [Gammaproteobacteria bacterium]
MSNDRDSGLAGLGDPVMKVRIEGMTDIESASELQKKLIEALNSGEKQVEMDMSGVDRMDTTSIQMLISFCSMVAGKKEVTWSGLTGELEHTIRLFGAGELLGIGA